MKYFILWVLMDGTMPEPLSTFSNLEECQQVEMQMKAGMAEYHRRRHVRGELVLRSPPGFVCLPEGAYPYPRVR